MHNAVELLSASRMEEAKHTLRPILHKYPRPAPAAASPLAAFSTKMFSASKQASSVGLHRCCALRGANHTCPAVCTPATHQVSESA